MRLLQRLTAGVLLLMLGIGVAGETVKDTSTGKPARYAGRFGDAKVQLPDHYTARRTEMRGAWVATVENIDFGKQQNVESFKKAYLSIVNNLKKANFNAVFFQVRPMNDAFYPSKLNPWSRWLTGAEGKSLGGNFDPLAFMVEEAHKRGLEFHAWLNPYRITNATDLPKADYLKTLDAKNFGRRHPELVLAATRGDKRSLLFLNPGEPAVVKHVVDTVAEIAEKYKVDAIVFDDYFYPYSGTGEIDMATYRKYNRKKLSLEDWRRENVDAVVRGVKEKLTEINRRKRSKIAFGISPFGIWANQRSIASGSLTGGKQAYLDQYADTRGWVRKGWVDYIAPQLYWPFSHDVAAYAALADWWNDAVKGSDANLYIALGPYRLGEEKKWGVTELVDQVRYNATQPQIDGVILFSYRNVFSPSNAVMKAGTQKLLREFWATPAVPPNYKNIK